MRAWRCGRERQSYVAALLIVASNLLNITTAFDCRIFIFHPDCRGSYGGKRSVVPSFQPGITKFGHNSGANLAAANPLNPETLSEDELLAFCSRYVFAPVCRGVTSKRSSIPALVGREQDVENPQNQNQNSEINSEPQLQVLQNKMDQFVKSYLANHKEEGLEEKPHSQHIRHRLDNTDQQGDEEEYNYIDNEYQQPIKFIPNPNDGETRYDPNKNYGHLKYRGKRDAEDELGGFSSFYKRDLVKRDAVDDLGAFSTFYKKNDNRFKRDLADELGSFSSFYKKNQNNARLKRDAVDDLGAFSTFYKKSSQPHKRDVVDDLGGFTTFYKKNNNRMKRDVIDDLGSFSSFYKRDRLLKRAAFNHDFLGTFSGFMNPNRFKRDSMTDSLGSFSSIYNPTFKTRNKRNVETLGNENRSKDRLRREVFVPFSFLFSPGTRRSD